MPTAEQVRALAYGYPWPVERLEAAFRIADRQGWTWMQTVSFLDESLVAGAEDPALAMQEALSG